MLNQLSLFAAVVKISSPLELIEAANSGICLENPALGSRLLAIVETPSRRRKSSNAKKKHKVLAVPNRSFFFQFRVDVEEDLWFGMCREGLWLVGTDLQDSAVLVNMDASPRRISFGKAFSSMIW